MPRFVVTFEDVAFIDSEAYAPYAKDELELTEEEVRGFTDVSLLEGTFPEGVLTVRKVSTSVDDSVYEGGEDENGEVKLFVSIDLEVEAQDEDSARTMDVPEDLLTRLVDALPASVDLERNWEVLETEPLEGAPAP